MGTKIEINKKLPTTVDIVNPFAIDDIDIQSNISESDIDRDDKPSYSFEHNNPFKNKHNSSTDNDVLDNAIGLDLLANPEKKLPIDKLIEKEIDDEEDRRSEMEDNYEESYENPIIIDEAFDKPFEDFPPPPPRRSSRSKHRSERSRSTHHSSKYDDDDESDFEDFSSRKKYDSDDDEPRLSRQEIQRRKQDVLYNLSRLERKGMRSYRQFNMESNLEDMEFEYNRMNNQHELNVSVKSYRKGLMMFVSASEWLNHKYNPADLELDRWSDAVMEDISSFDDTFEELHEKYKDKSKLAPELKLMYGVAQSAFMHHFQRKMLQGGMGPMGNPNMMNDMRNAFNNNANQPSPSHMPMPMPQVDRMEMSGPSMNMDDILNNVQPFSNDLDSFSAVDNSVLPSSDEDEPVEIKSVMVDSGNKKRKRRKI